MKSFTFDEQSVDRIATSVRWVEGQTVRQARRENPTTLGSTFGHLLHVQVQGTVAENAFGTGLVYEGAAGSETPGTEEVHFVNKSGRDLAANDDVWLCWPRIAGDHSGEAQAYWYSLAVGGDPATATRAVFDVIGVDTDSPNNKNGRLLMQPLLEFESDDIELLGNGYQIQLQSVRDYTVRYNVSFIGSEFQWGFRRGSATTIAIDTSYMYINADLRVGVMTQDVIYSSPRGTLSPGENVWLGPMWTALSAAGLVAGTDTITVNIEYLTSTMPTYVDQISQIDGHVEIVGL